MNLYTISYKHYNETKTISIVAASVLKAIEGTRFVQRQRYSFPDEILTIEKEPVVINRVQK